MISIGLFGVRFRGYVCSLSDLHLGYENDIHYWLTLL